MKIALIPSADLSYNSGSIIYAKNLYKYLIDNHHEVFMLGSKMPNDLSDTYIKNITISNNLLEHPIIDDRNITNQEYLDMFNSIVSFLLKVDKECHGLDIIHAHYASINSYAALFASKLINVPVIVSSFGRDINIGFNRDCRIKKMIISSFNEAQGIIAADKNIKDYININIVKKESNIKVIGMPLDITIFKAGDKIVKNPKKIIISTINSCFSEEKGIEKIINAFYEINKKYPDTVLYIAGTDDHPKKIHEKRIKKLIENKKIQDKVIFTGYLNRENVGSLLKNTDIYIDARENSNFSSVLLEAISIGTPIIASRNMGSLKVIIHDYNGLLFNQYSHKELLKCIDDLITHKNKRKRLSENGKKWLKKEGNKYLPEYCFNEVMKFYKSVQEEYNYD